MYNLLFVSIYTIPLTTRWPDALVVTPERKEGHKILEFLKRMYYTENTHFTYELFLLENLIGIWRNLLAVFPKQAAVSEDSSKLLREERMKNMLDYIHQNYSQPIVIQDIAAAVNISKSECFSELSKNDSWRIRKQLPPATGIPTVDHNRKRHVGYLLYDWL